MRKSFGCKDKRRNFADRHHALIVSLKEIKKLSIYSTKKQEVRS